MKIKILLAIAAVLTGCAAPQKPATAIINKEQPLEAFVREWKIKNSNKTGLLNEYLERNNTGRESKDYLPSAQESIPLIDAKKYGILEIAGKNKLKRLDRVEFNKKELLLALYSREAEREELMLYIYQKLENGRYKVIFSSKEEGNTFINAAVFPLGKTAGDIILLEYGVCVCNSTGKVYGSGPDSGLREMYAVEGESFSVRFQDLDNDGTGELIETKTINSPGGLITELREKFKDLNYRELLPAAMVTRTVIYKWDGKEFRNSGELYR